ncbi:MAG TPA: YciI family protein [Gaiellales bacterium]|nr:YciI family protein [Gaiellales bacterium]
MKSAQPEEAAVRFILFTYRDPDVQLNPEQRATVPAAVAAWCDEMDARGVRVAGHVLSPVSDARTICVREGELSVDGGPANEQTLHIAGFNILECGDVDEAVEVASKNPGASFGILELRPIVE